jgi:hypothetical protein
MVSLALSRSDEERLAAIAGELEYSINEFFGEFRDLLTDDQWALLRCYAGACIRRALDVGALLHAVVDAQQHRVIPYAGRGRETFVRDALLAWKDSFAPMRDVWRLGPVFERIPNGEKRILADVAVLEVMAANRAFATLDEQCAALLPKE